MSQSSNLWPKGGDVGLIAAIGDYLNRLQNSNDVDGDQRESLQVAVQCLQQALNTEQFPQPAFALEDMYRGFVESKAAASVVDSQDEKIADPQLKKPTVPEFSQFISMLTDRGFFKDCEPDSDEYKRRMEQARAKYNQKFPDNSVVSEEDKARALSLKAEGNELLKAKNIAGAIDKYSQAIEVDPSNAVFWCNRAAAYSHLKDFDAAARDASKSCELDPNYAKAHIRLAVAEKERGNFAAALKSYEAAADLTSPTANNFTSIMDNIQKCRQEVDKSSASNTSNPVSGGLPGMGAGMGGMPGMGGMDPNNLASMLGGLGGAGGLEGIMKNPMFAQMAQNMMQDPQMMNQMMNMMQDPNMADMARNFMGGGGNSAAGGASGDGNQSARQATLMKLLQDPDKMRALMAKVSADPEMQAMKADSTAAPLLERLERGDMSVLMELTSKPDILRRLQALLGRYIDEA